VKLSVVSTTLLIFITINALLLNPLLAQNNSGITITTATASIIITGDVFFDHTFGIADYPVEYPFARVQELFNKTDYICVNLETPVCESGVPQTDKKYVFHSKPGCIKSLTISGVDLACLANNHIKDQGNTGLEQTLEFLKANKIAYIGAGMSLKEARKPVITTVNGNKIAFLAYSNVYPSSFWATSSTTPGVAFSHPNHIKKDIAAIREYADIVITIFHWGKEREAVPCETQKFLSQWAIKNGADIVIGHHPHIIQGVQTYRGKPVVYSIGNFVFSAPVEISRDAMLPRIIVENKKVREIQFYPIKIRQFQPRIAAGKEAEVIISTFTSLSRDLGTTLRKRNNSVAVWTP